MAKLTVDVVRVDVVRVDVVVDVVVDVIVNVVVDVIVNLVLSRCKIADSLVEDKGVELCQDLPVSCMKDFDLSYDVLI